MAMASGLPAGFSDKVLSAQSTFRAVMNAMARPGTVQRIGVSVGAPEGMMRATAAVALTLFDHDTPIWLDGAMSSANVANWLKFHTAAPIVGNSATASFALIGDAANLPQLESFALGTNEYPDRSTTLIVEVESLVSGPIYRLGGPGIDRVARLSARIQPADLFDRLAINARLFPCGIDLILVHDDCIAAIPRTTRVVGQGD